MTNRVAIPGRPQSLYSGAISVDNVPVDLACELRQLVPHIDDLIQPRAEQITRSLVSCCFGRIAPSNAATESRHAIRGNPENETASFQGLTP
jgi:hypothetical protein